MYDVLFNVIGKRISEEEIICLLGDLVAQPSYYGLPNQETGVAEQIKAYFDDHEIEAEIQHVTDGRSNVIAVLKGTGNGKTLLLTGHTDTVPPYDMSGDPFQMVHRDGKLYGRGVVDMKGALACMMTAMAAIKKSGVQLSGDIVFAGVIDEEDKSEGTRALLKSGLKADGAVVGEPSNLEICIGHRGLEWFEFEFIGKTVHGGKQKEGINAIEKAARFMNRLECELLPKIEKRKHPCVGSSSMNYGKISGGTQPSTVAGQCTLQIDRRWIPGEDYKDIVAEYQKILDRMKEEDPKFSAKMKVMDVSLMEDGIVHEAMEIEPGHELVRITEEAIERVMKKKAVLTSFPAWTDGGLLSSYGKIPTIVLGPGDLESAHSASESIEISQLVPAAFIYAEIALQFCK